MHCLPPLAQPFEPANWFLTSTGGPNTEPIDLSTAKLHLKQDASADDALINTLITAARQQCEAYTNRVLGTQTFTQTQDGFSHFPVAYPSWCSGFFIYAAPLVSVDSITYVDPNGVTQTWANTAYDVVKKANGYSYVRPVFGTVYPITRWQTAAVTVSVTAGGSVPDALIAGMLLLIGHWYENREAVIHSRFAVELPLGVEALWQPYKVF